MHKLTDSHNCLVSLCVIEEIEYATPLPSLGLSAMNGCVIEKGSTLQSLNRNLQDEHVSVAALSLPLNGTLCHMYVTYLHTRDIFKRLNKIFLVDSSRTGSLFPCGERYREWGAFIIYLNSK